MRDFIKRLSVFLFIILFFTANYACASDIKLYANIDEAFTLENKTLPDELSFNVTEAETIPDVITIPAGSNITLSVLKAQRELRWHKSGLILCKIKSITPEGAEVPLNVEDKNLYAVVRKYEKVNKLKATLTGAELVVMQGASFFAPGVDIGYYFIKGAILNDKASNRFLSGVHNAYENSICWFWLKGKTIELSEGDSVRIKDLDESKLDKLTKKIDKRNERFERQAVKRLTKHDAKIFKQAIKNEKRMIPCAITENILESINVERTTIADINNSE